MFDVLADNKQDEVSHAEYDNIIRQLVSSSREDAGWYLRADDLSLAAVFNRKGQIAADSQWETPSRKLNSSLEAPSAKHGSWSMCHFKRNIQATDNGISTPLNTTTRQQTWAMTRCLATRTGIAS